MKRKEILNIISLALALTSFSIALLLYGEISGFEQGCEALRRPELSEMQDAISFSSHGPTIYEFLKTRYFIVVVAFLAYAVGQLTKWGSLSPLVCFTSLAIVLYQYWIMVPVKSMVLERQIHYPYSDWLVRSLQLDWACAFAAIGLAILQLADIYVNRFIPGQKRLKHDRSVY